MVLLKMYVKEGFEDLKKTTITDYNKFKEFYNEFMKNWNKAIVTSIGLNSEHNGSSSPPTPSQEEMNTYIDGLDKPYPHITAPLPEIDSTNIQKVLQMIPDDASKYVNALVWMNKSLTDALDSMKNVQGFEDKCDNLSNCMNDPAFLDKLAEAQKRNEIEKGKNAEQIISDRIKKFFSNNEIVKEMKKNIELVQKAEKIKTDLQNGNIPGVEKIEKRENAPINTKENDPSVPAMVNYFNQR